MFTQRVPDKRVVSYDMSANELLVDVTGFIIVFCCVSDYQRHPADGFGCAAGPSGCCCSVNMGSDGSDQVLSVC